MKRAENKVQRSFRLRPETMAKLEALAKKDFRDMTNMMEVLIERAAEKIKEGESA